MIQEMDAILMHIFYYIESFFLTNRGIHYFNAIFVPHLN